MDQQLDVSYSRLLWHRSQMQTDLDWESTQSEDMKREETETDMRRYYNIDDHFNENGTATVAELLFKTVLGLETN